MGTTSRLIIYSSVWSKELPFCYNGSGKKHFKTLQHARDWAKENGYDGIQVKHGAERSAETVQGSDG